MPVPSFENFLNKNLWLQELFSVLKENFFPREIVFVNSLEKLLIKFLAVPCFKKNLRLGNFEM